MINYEWQICGKPTADEVKGCENVILAVIWQYIGTDSETSISYPYQSTTFFVFNDESNFIPFEEITDEIIISWIEAKTDMDAVRIEIEEKIQEKTIPEVTPEPTSPEIPEI